MRDFAIFIAVVASSCATNFGAKYGTTAEYSETRRGYVIQSKDAPDDILYLTNPLTGTKLRCGEDVEFWKEAIARHRTNADTDDRAVLRGVLSTFPLSFPGIVLLFPGLGAYSLFKGASGSDFKSMADAEKDPAKQVTLLALAAANGNNAGTFRLGEILEQRGEFKRAIQAYWVFLILNYAASPT